MDAVIQTINQGSGQSRVTGERVGLVGERQIGGDDQAALFVAAAEEAEEVFGSGFVQRQVVQFVDHDQIGPRDAGFQPQDAAFFASQADRHMCFADAGCSQQSHVGFLGEELAASQVQHAAFIELRHGREVEVGEFFRRGEVRRLQASLNRFRVPGLHLAIGQTFQERFVRGVARRAVTRHRRIVPEHRRQLERLEGLVQQQRIR